MQKYTTATATVYYTSSTTATTDCCWVESDSTEAMTVVCASECHPQRPPAEEVAAEKTEEVCEEEQAVAEFIPPRELLTAYRRRPLQLPSSYG